MTDFYEFKKSSMPQHDDNATPYSNKQWNYINDINGGSYGSQGVSLVQIDCTSIFNSSSLIDVNQMYITVPLSLVSAISTNAALVAPVQGHSWAYHGLKAGYHNLLQGADLQIDGTTVEQFVPNISPYAGFKLLSEMSQDDLNAFGYSLGLGRQLDNFQSLRFNCIANQTNPVATTAFPVMTNLTGVVGGNGLSNNMPFNLGTAGNSGAGDSLVAGAQYYQTTNVGLYSRLLKPVDVTGTSATTGTSLFGASASTGGAASTFQTLSMLNNEFKATTQVLNTNYVVTYDTAIIRLGDIFNSLKKWPLSKRFSGIIRLYFNVGAVGSGFVATSTNGQMIHSMSSNTFTGVCPIVQNSLPANIAYGGTATQITTGLGIVKPPPTALSGFFPNLANSGASHPMSSVRLYYPQVTLKPTLANSYILSNRNKQVEYTSVLYNQFNGITSGSTFSQLIQSGVSRIKSLIIFPVISSTINGLVCQGTFPVSGVTPFSDFQSPFSQCPNQNGPISLTNLQVSVGGSNQLYQTLNYGYENFLEQVSQYEKVNSSDFGISCGLISQQMWENAYRVYFVDLSRSLEGDMINPRNITFSFNNNTNITIDILTYVEYYQIAEVDVETGRVTKK